MEQEVNKVLDIWKESYTESLNDKRHYQSVDQIKQIASYFSPGRTYYYIMNFHDLTFEFVSDDIHKITGLKKDELSIDNILKICVDLPIIQQKENVVKDFIINYTTGDELLDYKFLYTYQIKQPNKEPQTILLQNVILMMTEGNVQNVLGIHTDITHLNAPVTEKLSIINLKGGESYYNIDSDSGKFLPDTASKKSKETLTEREKEIVQYLAKGLNAEDIGKRMNISLHTVRTHRRNMLRKMDSQNTTDLVVRCIADGVVSI